MSEHRMATAKWILRRKYGSRVNRYTEKWIVNQQEVQRINTSTTTY
jgi:hypothetical protein